MQNRFTRHPRFCSFLLAGTLLLGNLSIPVNILANGGGNGPAKLLTPQQRAFHLLNRVTFGPRPGDVERVLKMGWEKYLDEQLHPDRITDTIVEEKLRTIPSIHLSAQQLAANYPPGVVINRELKARGIDIAAAREQRQQIRMQKESAPQTDVVSPALPSANGQNDPAEKRPAVNEYRREILQIMMEKGWKPQQQALTEAQQAKILRAVYSERQLQEVLTDFWFNHFNVYSGKGPMKMMITPYERDTIRPLVFGKFEDLLRATAKSPAMLFYLDNWQSIAPNASVQAGLLRRGRPDNQKAFDRPFKNALRRNQNLPPERSSGNNDPAEISPQMPQMTQNLLAKPKRGINENYAREIMELHTLGVDGGYTQKDVQEVARCLTGWTINQPILGGGFYFAPRLHDGGEKLVLGKNIGPGGGINDGEAVIKLLAHHPSTAKFIARKLAIRFVADNPPQSLIDRATREFQKTDGDLRQVVRSILTSPEFWAAENHRSKIKTPFELTVSAVRALGANTDGMPAFHRWMAQMGEALYQAQPPTGYKDEAEIWVNAGALLQRMNFALTLSSNRIPGTRVNLQSLSEKTLNATASQKIDQVVKLLLNGEMSAQTRATLGRQLSESPTLAMNDPSSAQSTNSNDIVRVVSLVLGSPEFQRQ